MVLSGLFLKSHHIYEIEGEESVVTHHGETPEKCHECKNDKRLRAQETQVGFVLRLNRLAPVRLLLRRQREHAHARCVKQRTRDEGDEDDGSAPIARISSSSMIGYSPESMRRASGIRAIKHP